MKSSQSTIEEAVAFLCAQKDANLDVSVRSVAWQFGISHATLERRLEGGLTNPLSPGISPKVDCCAREMASELGNRRSPPETASNL
jgi:hypothetical protein